MILQLLNISSRFYWINKIRIHFVKKYLFKYHVLPIISEINEQQIFDKEWSSLYYAVSSAPFKGILEHLFKPNNYLLNTKDIAIALNMGVFGHSTEPFKGGIVIDAAYYLTKKLKERIILDKNLKDVFSDLEKKPTEFNNSSDRNDIEELFSDKKLLFKNYFEIYQSLNCSEFITVYFPGYGKSWIDWNKDESIDIPIYKNDIPTGFFLSGFDYKSNNDGWIRNVIRKNDREYYNPFKYIKGKLIWAQ